MMRAVKWSSVFGLLGLMTAILPSLAWAGFEHGNGGDSAPFEVGSAWFLDPSHVIQVCIKKDANFGVNDAAVSQAIGDAFGAWKKYYAEKVKSSPSGFLVQPTFEFQLLPSCIGSEDLVVYMGESSPEVEKAKTGYYHPIAFAERTSYEVNQGWGKGFIWIAGNLPEIDWSAPSKLLGILLHEFGHVYGCDHVAGTIMTADIRRLIMNAPVDPVRAKRVIGHIDAEKELVLNPWGSFAYDGKISTRATNEEQAETFKLLTGRDPVGSMSARLASEAVNELILTLGDQNGSTEIRIPVLDVGDVFESSVSAFKTVRRVHYDNLAVLERNEVPAGTGSVELGILHGPNQESYQVVIERNSGGLGSPVRLRYFQKGRTRDLFFAVQRI